MEQNKFETEVKTLKSFFETYCHSNEHENRVINSSVCTHKDFSYTVELDLCGKCRTLIDYSIKRLEECPHEIKPRCRTCPNPCYEKNEWKKLAKVMRYSGVRLGVVKVKEKMKSILKFKP
ncbi:nitrous oxide-stimulated promoter family protein [Sulfurimonas sp. HSL-1716]|uniref:nitrous oxide-stimulated promoter family protein n=1 Tax=Hydrocurvibacter sulfurireducens TaxID=3131937 RepID=UPI0031F855E5